MPWFSIYFLNEIFIFLNCGQQDGTIIFGWIKKEVCTGKFTCKHVQLYLKVILMWSFQQLVFYWREIFIIFSFQENYPHICLDILFREVSDHCNHIKQCHQVMPLEMDNQLGLKTSFSDTQVNMLLFLRSKVPISGTRFYDGSILYLLSWLPFGVLHYFLKQCFICYLCMISTKHLANGGSYSASSM